MILCAQLRNAISCAVIALELGVFLAPSGVVAQPAQKVYRVGSMAFDVGSPNLAAFLQRFSELGYSDGTNVRFEHVNKGSFDQQASELVQKQVDLIFVSSDQIIRAAQRATSSIPIVFVGCDLVAAGLIDSLSRPGGNLTGVSCNTNEVGAKRLQILKEISPRLSRVGLLYNSGAPGTQVVLRLTGEGAQRLGVAVPPYGVAQSADIEPALATMQRDGVGGVIVVGDYLTYDHRQLIADQAARYKMPTSCSFRANVAAGCLFSYGPSLHEMFRLAADYADKVLKGAKPADLPVQEPTKYEMILNLKTAKALGVTIPQTVRLRVDEVIE